MTRLLGALCQVQGGEQGERQTTKCIFSVILQCAFLSLPESPQLRIIYFAPNFDCFIPTALMI